MLKPRALHSGDRLAIVAPASPFDRDEFDQGIREIRALGFEPVFDDSVFDRRGYVAGEAGSRAAALTRAWSDTSIAGLVAVRGGYGSVQVLPHLEPDLARRARKVFIGYSDLTSVLIFLNAAGLVCFHGPMLAGRLGRGADGYDRDSFLRSVTRAEPVGELCPPGLETIHEGEAAGPLYGGTLTQLVASLGTPFAFDPPDGHVLFFEEVAERPYRLDRMLTQLRLSGVLQRAAAIVVGELPKCDEPGGVSGRSVIADVLRDFRKPIVVGFPSGHTTGPSWTLPLGVSARVVADHRPRVIIEESAVE